MTDETMDIDSLLDSTLDDLEDLPSFEPYPAGAHQVLASLELKEVEGLGACVELTLKLQETLELSDPQDATLVEGSETSVLFILSNKFGAGNFKKCAASFAEMAGTRVNREIIEAVTEVECVVVTSLRKDKNDPDKFYTNVKEIQVV